MTGESKREPGARGNPHPPAPAARSLTHRRTHTHTLAPASVFFVSPVSSFLRRRRPREENGGGGDMDPPTRTESSSPRDRTSSSRHVGSRV